MKKTKIVATLGPASSDKETLLEMINQGVNVCRMNFSHGSYDDHAKVAALIREINDETGFHIGILADLQGPKIRVGEVENNGVELVVGEELIITTKECIGTKEKVYLTYTSFPSDVSVGDILLMDDGKLKLKVISTDSKENVVTKIIHGGILSSKKGVNLPNTKISMPSLTEKDRKDLDFALGLDVDWVGLSFVRTARDIIELKHIISSQKKHAKVIAKIEKPEAIEDIEDIISETDAVMIARGDLGVEVPMEKVPNLQKTIIKACREKAKPTIVATQMMESMIINFAPTRAEVNDGANAVMDGADAVMLSGETSVGKYPVEVINTMANILISVENSELINVPQSPPKIRTKRFITKSICHHAALLANDISAKAISTLTNSGYTAFQISAWRPESHILVFTSNKKFLIN
jgi:pyruvate kinase